VPWPDRRDALAAAALLVLVVALFGRLVFRGEVLYDRDVAAVFHPMAESFFQAWRAGSLPLWNPWFSFGEPMLANPSAQVLYPPTWMMLAVPPATYYTMYVLAHLALGGLGLYVLGRDLGLARASAWVGSAVWTLSGPLLSLVNVWHHLGGACWMPWAIWAGRRALTTLRAREAAIWGLLLAGQALAGSPDLSLLTLVASAFCLGPEMVGRLRSQPRRAAGVLAVGAAVAIASAAGQWLPTLDVARRGMRLELTSETRGFWSLHPWTLPQVLAPLSWRALPEHSPRAAELFEAWAPFLSSLYLGAPALVLVAAAWVPVRAEWRRRLTLLALAAFLLALGRHTPLYAAATSLVPPLRITRYPIKFAVLSAFGWALLAATGVEAWRRRSESENGRWTRRVVVPGALVALALGAAAVAAARASLSTVESLLLAPDPAAAAAAVFLPAARALGWAAGLLAVALILGVVKARPAWAGAAALAVADLLWAHSGLNPSAPSSFYGYRPEILRSRAVEPGMRVCAWDYVPMPGRTPRRTMAGAFMDVPPGPAQALAGALGLQTYLYPPISARWAVYGSFDRDLLGLTSRAVSDLRALFVAADDTPALAPVLRLGAVDVAITLHDIGPPFVPAGTFADAPRRLATRAFRVPSPLPRIFVVTRAVERPGSDFGPFVRGELDPASTIILDSGPLPPGSDEGNASSARLEGLVERPDQLHASVETDRPAWLVWVNAHDPGWRASVDGAAAPLLRANHAFMAVAVPPGRHVLDLRYRPPAVGFGLAGSLAGLVTGLTLALRRPR